MAEPKEAKRGQKRPKEAKKRDFFENQLEIFLMPRHLVKRQKAKQRLGQK
jgi:hypothetical protein